MTCRTSREQRNLILLSRIRPSCFALLMVRPFSCVLVSLLHHFRRRVTLNACSLNISRPLQAPHCLSLPEYRQGVRVDVGESKERGRRPEICRQRNCHPRKWPEAAWREDGEWTMHCQQMIRLSAYKSHAQHLRLATLYKVRHVCINIFAMALANRTALASNGGRGRSQCCK